LASEKRRQKHIQRFFEAKEKGHEHQKLKKRAAELRRAEERKSGARRRKVRRVDWEDLIDGDAHAFDAAAAKGAKATSTNAWLARLVAEQAALEAGAEAGGDAAGDALARDGLAEATVVFATAGACRVELADGTLALCDLDAELRRTQRSSVAVGDRALVELVEPARGRLRCVLPRVSRLSRPDPHDPRLERVLAANVELVLVVAALREPRLSVGLVERVVLAVQRGGAVPLVVATKLDLCADAEALASLAPLRATGVDVVACSAKTGAGIDELRARVAGRLCALVGHSGVGKSSLLNALDPALAIVEGRVRAADGKGRHTTTASALHRLADGTRLIDTPGVREFGLWGMTRAELGAAFPDVAAAAERCRFHDCTHDHEPDCAVRAAAASGALSEARYRSYLRILETLGG
jgi:ribosome biogenesis GTPase